MIDKSWYQRHKGVKEEVAAGGIIIRCDNDRIYIALTSEVKNGAYILPKGRVEPGEDIQQTAVREISEEVGLTELKFIDKLSVLSRLNFKKTAWKTTHYFLFSTTQIDGTPSDENYDYQLEWFDIERIPSIFWPEQEKLISDNIEKIKRLTRNSTFPPETR